VGELVVAEYRPAAVTSPPPSSASPSPAAPRSVAGPRATRTGPTVERPALARDPVGAGRRDCRHARRGGRCRSGGGRGPGEVPDLAAAAVGDPGGRGAARGPAPLPRRPVGPAGHARPDGRGVRPGYRPVAVDVPVAAHR